MLKFKESEAANAELRNRLQQLYVMRMLLLLQRSFSFFAHCTRTSHDQYATSLNPESWLTFPVAVQSPRCVKKR
jgi:hypothetical protein